MRKTTQAVEIEVEGPDGAGNYRVGNITEIFYRKGLFDDLHQQAIQKHIDSAPKFTEIDGLWVGPGHNYRYAAWETEDIEEVPLVGVDSLDEAWESIRNDVECRDTMFASATLAIIKYIEQEKP